MLATPWDKQAAHTSRANSRSLQAVAASHPSSLRSITKMPDGKPKCVLSVRSQGTSHTRVEDSGGQQESGPVAQQRPGPAAREPRRKAV